jgi:hypothetical protein
MCRHSNSQLPKPVTLVDANYLQFYMYLCNQVEEDENGGICSANGGEDEREQVVGGKARGEEAIRKTKT